MLLAFVCLFFYFNKLNTFMKFICFVYSPSDIVFCLPKYQAGQCNITYYNLLRSVEGVMPPWRREWTLVGARSVN